jgi:hypothetical protein
MKFVARSEIVLDGTMEDTRMLTGNACIISRAMQENSWDTILVLLDLYLITLYKHVTI